MDTAVEVSEIYMLSFDRKFLEKLKKLGLEVLLYSRYVDDITVECPAIRKGWSYDPESDTLKYDGEKTCQLENDARTLGILGEIASSIDPNLKFTVDFPTANQDGRLPILDLTVWMDGNDSASLFLQEGVCHRPDNSVEVCLTSNNQKEHCLC